MECFNVVVHARLKWSIDPHALATQDAHRNLAPQPRCLAFVRAKISTGMRNAKVCTIDAHQAIISNVTFLAVFPLHL